MDGNGRVSRAIMMQQCLDLFGKADMTLMNKGAEYYAALEAADGGDFAPLGRAAGLPLPQAQPRPRRGLRRHFKARGAPRRDQGGPHGRGPGRGLAEPE
jgi:hypothetical protein